MSVLSRKANLKSDVVSGFSLTKILGIFFNTALAVKANTIIPNPKIESHTKRS